MCIYFIFTYTIHTNIYLCIYVYTKYFIFMMYIFYVYIYNIHKYIFAYICIYKIFFIYTHTHAIHP